MRTAPIWIYAALFGASVAAFAFEASVGINVLIIVVVAAVAIGLVARREPRTLHPTATLLGFALALSGTCAVTTVDPYRPAAIAISFAILGIVTIVAATVPSPSELDARYMVTAPFRAFARSLVALRVPIASATNTRGVRSLSPRARGAIVAIPIVGVFALLFASADPIFAAARDWVDRIFHGWGFFPRLGLGILAGVAALGALTVAAGMEPPRAPGVARVATWPLSRFGTQERTIVLYSVATISWIFVLFQVSYLFSNASALQSSGVTFAEYARRGFADMAVAASIATALILGAHSRSASDSPDEIASAVRIPSLALIVAGAAILASAFHRVSLYEQAYGFTTARVDAQAYMSMVLSVLVLVAVQLVTRFDGARLARHSAAVTLTIFIALGYWNDAAWVARKNIERYRATGKIDAVYIGYDLGEDAVPAIAASLAALPAACVIANLARLHERKESSHAADRWFEWNARRSAARTAYARLWTDSRSVRWSAGSANPQAFCWRRQ